MPLYRTKHFNFLRLAYDSAKSLTLGILCEPAEFRDSVAQSRY